MSNSNDSFYFLQGGGEMGKITRANDWSKTPLGSPETWPQSLQTMVSVVLNNPFAMCIAWGKEYTQIYNDCYRPILGKQKHPQSLTRCSREIFADVWHIIESMFDDVMNGTPVGFSDFMLPLERDGYIENCHFDFAFSPIRLETGDVGGVLVTVIETTTKKTVQDELKLSEERFKMMADNIPNLAWMAKPDGSLYWYNKKWYEYTGTTFQDMQGWGWQSVYKEEQLDDVIREWKSSLQAGVPFEMVRPLKGADGSYCDFLTRALPVKNEQNEIVNWFGTNTDITYQNQTEVALIENRSQLEFVLEAAQLGTFDFCPETNKFTANDRLKKWFGLSLNEQIDLSDATNNINENDRSKVTSAIQKALDYNSGGNYDIAYNIINPISKKEITLHAKGKVWFNANKIAYRFNGTVEDITAQTIARKKLEVSELSLRLMILQAPIAISILRGKDHVVEIANKFALELWGRAEEEVLNKSIVEVMFELRTQGIKELLDDVLATGNRFASTELPVKIMRSGRLETVYINLSYEPLFDEAGNTNGIMAIGFDVTEQFLARQKIEKSEQNIRSLVESAPFPIGVFIGREMRVSLANQSLINAWGKGDDIIGKLYCEVLPELENQNIYKQLDDVFTTGIAFHAKNQRVEILKDGSLQSYYFNYSFTPLFDSQGKVYGVMNTAAEVTEVHEAKKKIEESEKKFRDAVQQAPTAMVVLRGEDNIVETVNNPYLELVDKTQEEFLNKPLFESLPDVEVAVSQIIKDIYSSGEAFYGFEFPIILERFGKKETTYFNFVYHPLKENNIVTGIMVAATEVTATVQAKKELEEKEQKLNVVITASELGIWELNLETGESITSDRALEILGFKDQKDISREQILSNYHPEDKLIREDAFEKAFVNGSLHYEVRTIIDNQIHWIEARGKVFYDSDVKPIRMLGTLRDVTDEKKFQNQLLEREQKFRLLANSMPQMIWTSDPEGHLNYFNDAVFEYSGLNEEQIGEKGWITIVHEDDKEENIQKWTESIFTEKDFLVEHRFRKADGSYRWQLTRAIPQRDLQGKITMWVGTSTDIQDQKMFANELEKQVAEHTKELYQKNDTLHNMNKELQSFAYISSHDLQEPLRKIQTYAGLINEKEAENLSEGGKDKFRRMQNAANRMQNLIQDLLAYSRTSIQERKFEKMKLSTIVDEVKDDFTEELHLKNTQIVTHNDCEINVIPFQFRQLLFNLISNSLKFTKDNVAPTISITCEIALGSDLQYDKLNSSTKYSHIQIKDNGIGFEAAFSQKIFEVFQRLHGREKFEGTGIGLAIVKKIVDNHYGFITATGIVNQGATFDIYLPA